MRDVSPTVRVRGVEGLRAIAASLIVVYHCWLYGSPGGGRVDLGWLSGHVLPYLPVGVTLFFCLSAFLLYRPIADAVVRGTRRQPLRSYLRNRALRILPAYWVILLALGLVLGAGVVRTSTTDVGLANLAAHPSVLLLNLGLVQNLVPATVITGIPPAWSLAVEVAFYLALPALGWIGARAARAGRTPRGRLAGALLPAGLLLVLGLSGKAAAWWLVPSDGGPVPGWQGDWHSVLVRSFWTQADLFAFGMALAVVWVAVHAGALRLPRGWRAVAAVVIAGVAASTTRFGEGQVLGDSMWSTLLALGCTLVLALVVLDASTGAPYRVARALDSRVLGSIGLVSYSLFLWHEPLVRWLAARGLTAAGRTGFVVNVAMVLAIGLALAALTYRFVERPALDRKGTSAQRRFARRGRGAHIIERRPTVG
jgi:peptidoglycan/LPS O-acetylase OafA/YrhL